MATYEFEAINPKVACDRCLEGFEHAQRITDDLITNCPYCGSSVRQIISVNSFALRGDGWTRRGV